MKDYSYEILDLMKKYDGNPEKALEGETSPQCLYAFSPLRENLFEWVEITKEDRVLQIGSDYGSYTGLLARKAGEVVVVDTRDENLEVNGRRHADQGNIHYMRGDILALCRVGLAFQSAAEGNGAVEDFVHAAETAALHGDRIWKEYQPGGGTTGQVINPLTEERYDYVVTTALAGAGTKEEAAILLEYACSLLKPGGILLAAAENEAGVRYRMGARLGGTGFLETEFRGIFEEIVRKYGGSFLMYYPVPDYRYPVTLYSDAHLPGVGDVSNISARLDGPGLWFGNEEEAMTRACRNGEFTGAANSFLGMYQVGEDGYTENGQDN